MALRFLNAENLRKTLPMANAIDAMHDSFCSDREIPLRRLLGGMLFMPGRVKDNTGIKVVSTKPGNPGGLVMIFDSGGSPIGIIDAQALTTIRTGAACGLATRLCAAKNASTLAMLGAGALALDQISAIKAVRPLKRIIIWSRIAKNAEKLAAAIGGEIAFSPEEAVCEADIISTATPAKKPLFGAGDITRNVHINAVGSYRPDMIEIPVTVLKKAWIVVDDQTAASVEAGELIQAKRNADASMGDLITGRAKRPAGKTTIFKCTGNAGMDIAPAVAALRCAEENGIGDVLA